MMLNKAILGGIITTAIIIIAIGFVVLGESENIDIGDQSVNQTYIPKKITLELSDGIDMGEAGPWRSISEVK